MAASLAAQAEQQVTELCQAAQAIFSSLEKQKILTGHEAGADQVFDKVESVYAQLSATVEQLAQHQLVVQRKQQLLQGIAECDAALLRVVQEQKSAEQRLEHVLRLGMDEVASYDRAAARVLTVDEVVAYASKISYTSFVPVASEGQEPAPSRPPHPQQEHLALGVLGKPFKSRLVAAATTSAEADGDNKDAPDSSGVDAAAAVPQAGSMRDLMSRLKAGQQL